MSGAQLYQGPEGDYLARWKRIHLIDALVRKGDFPSANRLAKACGVSAKSIYRDIEAMRSELRAPLEYDARRKGHHYTSAGYQIPATALSERDLFALMVTENAVTQYEGTPLAAELRDAFDRVLATLPSDLRARHAVAARAVHFAGLPPTPIPPAVWNGLVDGILGRRRVTLHYRTPARGKAEPRTVDPYLLVVRDREWFLVGRTQHSRHYALFYVPRIAQLERLDEPYEPDPDFSPERYFEYGFNAMHGEGRPQEVELRFEREHAHIAEERAWAAKQTVTRLRTGAVLVRFKSNTLFEVARQVLRFGGTVEVRKPAELRRDVLAQAERTLARHRGKVSR